MYPAIKTQETQPPLEDAGVKNFLQSLKFLGKLFRKSWNLK